jgi:hypothetical protein
VHSKNTYTCHFFLFKLFWLFILHFITVNYFYWKLSLFCRHLNDYLAVLFLLIVFLWRQELHISRFNSRCLEILDWWVAYIDRVGSNWVIKTRTLTYSNDMELRYTVRFPKSPEHLFVQLNNKQQKLVASWDINIQTVQLPRVVQPYDRKYWWVILVWSVFELEKQWSGPRLI